MSRHPWNFDSSGDATKELLERGAAGHLRDFTDDSIGRDATTQAADIYYVPDHMMRRNSVGKEHLMPLVYGELVRNWQFDRRYHALWPYDEKGRAKLSAEMRELLGPHQRVLEQRSQFSKTTLEAGLQWFEYREYHVRGLRCQVLYADIATHNHFTISSNPRTMNQHAVLFTPRGQFEFDRACLFLSLLNSSIALFWLKQICFNKGAGDEEHRDRFEYAGGKVAALPIAAPIVEALRNTPNPTAESLTTFAHACWERGGDLPSLSGRKLFEKTGEAYYAWNRGLPGYVAPHAILGSPFTTTTQLRERFADAVSLRDQVRSEMIALQEEMDWLAYQAYGLIDVPGPPMPEPDLSLDREQRPFQLWAEAEGDFDKAVALIPGEWSKAKRALWTGRLTLIRDNEHVRRIEQPIYKRRWDEQWKVDNRWECGPPAYDAEFLDAFSWWLSEKAEWWLEQHKSPVNLDDWMSALWCDPRVQAAWPVAAEASHRLETWRGENSGKTINPAAKPNPSKTAFARFFKALVKKQCVPDDIPFAVPWDDLKKKLKRKIPATVKSIRGKLNVPRERFWINASNLYRQAKPIASVTEPSTDLPSCADESPDEPPFALRPRR
jgi:hypothetical protein